MRLNDTVARVLSKWADYTKYDPEQHRFVIGSLQYEFHVFSKRIQEITDNYDASGTLGMLYAKNAFIRIMSECQVSAMDVLRGTAEMGAEEEMWAAFNGDDVTEIEDAYLNAIGKLTEQVLGKRMLGDASRGTMISELNEAIDKVIEELSKCTRDIYRIGGEIKPIKKVSPAVHVFQRLAECVIALERAEDGAYCCYICNMGTIEGYFGLFFKSNGNIFSIHDRVDEPYVRAHFAHRNKRWTEGKCQNLFPYRRVVNVTSRDYKGFASTVELAIDDHLAFSQMQPRDYLPVVIAISLLSTKFAGTDFCNADITILNSLLPQCIAAGGEPWALANVSGSEIAQLNANYHAPFSLESVLSGAAGEELEPLSLGAGSRHYFICENQIFVDMYGHGFQFDPENLIADASIRTLTDGGTSEIPAAEFVGTANRMNILAYYEVRRQLAQHIRDEMLREYLSFGGITAVTDWWVEAIRGNRQHIEALCVEFYETSIQGSSKAYNNPVLETVRFLDTRNYPSGLPHSSMIFFNEFDTAKRAFIDKTAWSRCSLYFTFTPRDWLDLEALCGKPVPRIVKGYKKKRRSGGNSILEATDIVNEVGTPFETNEKQKNGYYGDEFWFNPDRPNVRWPDWVPESFRKKRHNPTYDFTVSIGFSKRNFAAIRKRYNKDCLNNYPPHSCDLSHG